MVGIGSEWSPKELTENCVLNDKIEEIVESIIKHLDKAPLRPVLITGGSGVGKSVLIDLVAQYFYRKKTVCYTVTAGNLKAGNRYIGDLENALKNFIEDLVADDAIWIAPRFHELYYAGKHDSNPSGILDQIIPILERNEIRMIGEINESDLEKLTTLNPNLQNTFEIIRILPSSQDFTLNLAKEWIRIDKNQEKWASINDPFLEDLYFMSKQYLSYRENPGALIDFLNYTKKKFTSTNEPLSRNSFYESLSSLTGLPISILNDNEKLDLEKVRHFFNSKVVGQDEAVNVLVERMAMIKAGLTDPDKPFGVFLFVGPTGTGKTEITKCLAEYLFSSTDRMIRLDMSEFQTADSYIKIFGNYGTTSESNSLVNEIRKNPFSVILLDEFEKAHYQVWDLFLQVFDDGRLTDSQGSVVDFRQSIIIMTSNAGASIPSLDQRRRALGFNPSKIESAETKNPAQNVMDAVNEIFRPEFVNRIDKIVVFNPLSHAALSKILNIELKKVLKRRGLKNRKWALDMEESAVSFLLEKGYTHNLGARPLKRAIEQYLLAPLALTIVNHNFPKGDQFLLVSKSKDKLKVSFIDPDEPEYTWEEKMKVQKRQEEVAQTLSLKKILRDCLGTLGEFKCIKKELKALNEKYLSADISAKKENLMSMMSEQDFWQSDRKQDVLSQIEFFDRFQEAYNTSNKLFERLEDPEKDRLKYDPSLLKKLAQRTYLLDKALASYFNDESQDALIKVTYTEEDKAWGETLIKMYNAWAKLRKMEFKSIFNSKDTERNYHIFSIAGFGAYHILSKEHGLHFQEQKKNENMVVTRRKAHVIVLPLLSIDYENKLSSNYLTKRFAGKQSNETVRKFNLDSNQCKDLINKWQTGNVDKVLNGGFDLIE